MFTLDNTDGFTQADLDRLNAAAALLDTDGIDAQNIADILNNAWYDGITVDELVAAASRRLGRS